MASWAWHDAQILVPYVRPVHSSHAGRMDRQADANLRHDFVCTAPHHAERLGSQATTTISNATNPVSSLLYLYACLQPSNLDTM